MKLHLTATNENGVQVSKGANEHMEVRLTLKNRLEYIFLYNEHGLMVDDHEGRTLLETGEFSKGITFEGTKCPTCFAQYSEKNMWCVDCEDKKGKKCTECGESENLILNWAGVCHLCTKQTKGKKQKDDICPYCGSKIDEHYQSCTNKDCDYTV